MKEKSWANPPGFTFWGTFLTTESQGNQEKEQPGP
jgi:hypothetical protein